MTGQRPTMHIGAIVLGALFIGLSLAGGPVLWAVLAMLGIPIGLFALTRQAAHSGSNPSKWAAKR